jgi:hypothetical protein
MIAADANDPKGIVWIASYPKSGNTWLRIFLHHLVRIKTGRPVEEREIDRVGDTSPSIAGRVDLFAKFMGKPLAGAEMRDVVLARPKVQEALVQQASGLLTLKTHSVMGRVFNVPLISLGVSVGAVYVVRNPLDVALSMANYLTKSVDGAIRSMGAPLNASPSTAQQAAEIWGSWSENVKSWTTNPPPVIKVLRYEDMIEDPIGNFTAVAEHMRFGATAAEIEEAVYQSSFDQLSKQEQESGFIERPGSIDRFFRVGRAGQWRERLTPEQVKRIVSDHEEEMRRFNYLPD